MNDIRIYYLHLSANTLAHIFVAGCIRPAILIENKEVDIQNIAPEHILLSSKCWSKEYDCSLKLSLTPKEISQLVVANSDYYLYNSFLPISRINRIYFENEEKAQTILWNIRNGAGFIPDRIVEIKSKTIEHTASDFNNKDSFYNPDIDNVKRNYLRFNRLIGGIAFLRVARFNLFDESINYPENYIPTVSYFNKSIEREFVKTKSIYNKSLHTFFTAEEPILRYLNKIITETVIEEVANKENVALSKKFGTSYNLEIIPKNTLTFVLCLLNTYGRSGIKSLEDFIGDYFAGSFNEKNEFLALVFGIYTGYSSIRNYYKIRNVKINVKFELDSKLDSYIIESIFNFVTQENLISGDFDYIDKEFTSRYRPKRNPDYRQYYIFDTLISIREKDYSEHLKQIVREISEVMASLFPKDFIKVDSNALETHFSKKLKVPFLNIINEIKSDFKNLDELQETEKKIAQSNETLGSELSNIRENDKVSDIHKAAKIRNENKKKITAKSLNKNLFDIVEGGSIISEQAIMNANTTAKLKTLAKECRIQVPPEISKKQELIDYLLTKCSK